MYDLFRLPILKEIIIAHSVLTSSLFSFRPTSLYTENKDVKRISRSEPYAQGVVFPLQCQLFNYFWFTTETS